MPVVLLMGKSGAGKDTAADIIQDKYAQISRLHFAYPLKKFGLSLGFARESLYGTQQEKCVADPFVGVSGRHFMEKFGMLMRAQGHEIFGLSREQPAQSIWTVAMKNYLEESQDEDTNFVITDGRFADEARLVKDMGGVVIKLIAAEDAAHAMNPPDAGGITQYESERELHAIEPDYTVINDPKTRTMNTLTRELTRVLDSHLKRKSWLARHDSIIVFIIIWLMWFSVFYFDK